MTAVAWCRLGPYEITRPSAQGGMGEVYRARDTRIDRTVALKILGGTLSSTSTGPAWSARRASSPR